jgi:two-component system response regulator YesN
MDYILKPTLTPVSLLVTLKKSAAKIKMIQSDIDPEIKLENDLNQYLSGYQSDFKFEKLTEHLSDQPYYILYSSLSLYKQPQEMRQQIVHYFNLIASDFSTIKFITSQNDIGLVLATNADKQVLYQALLEKLTLLSFVESHPFFCLSRAFTTMTLLKPEFEGIKTASQHQRFYFKTLPLVDDKDLLDYQYSADFDSNRFLKLLVNKDYLEGLALANDYLNDLLIHTVSPIFLKEQTSTIFYNLFNVLENNKHFQADFAKIRMDFIMTLNSCDFSDDYALLVRKMIQSLELTLNTRENQDDLFQAILAYIEAHFQEQITLTSISEQFHFSYNYLSSYFSSHYNETFSDYLKDLRMKKAKKLMARSDLNLSEIAAAVGYSDLAYFSKVFKKVVGMTPSKYRRGDY